MKILKVVEAEKLTFHGNRGNKLTLGLGPVAKKYVDVGDDTPENVEEDDEDAEDLDVPINASWNSDLS